MADFEAPVALLCSHPASSSAPATQPPQSDERARGDPPQIPGPPFQIVNGPHQWGGISFQLFARLHSRAPTTTGLDVNAGLTSLAGRSIQPECGHAPGGELGKARFEGDLGVPC